MARALRIQYPRAVYHVMSRGDHGEAIYWDDADRELYLKCLEELYEKTGWWIHAWVLMNNHYHLLLETPEANLVMGMKWLQGTYTSRFNSRHKILGHLFQGRYKALVVDDREGRYFQVVSSYIHLNPVRARLVRGGDEPLRGYRWSSYPGYLAPARKRPEWLRTDRVLGAVGISASDQRAAKDYEVFMEGRALECNRKKPCKELEEQWRRIRRGWYLGDENFKQRLVGLIRAKDGSAEADSHTGPAVRARAEMDAETWLKRGLEVVGRTETELADLARGAGEKLVLAWWLRRHTTLSRKWIARRLDMGHESRVTLAVREVNDIRRGRLPRLRKALKKLADELKAR